MKCGLVSSEFQWAAESIIEGAIRERVDILIAPSRETRSSSQGTVAASPTRKTTLITLQSRIYLRVNRLRKTLVKNSA